LYYQRPQNNVPAWVSHIKLLSEATEAFCDWPACHESFDSAANCTDWILSCAFSQSEREARRTTTAAEADTEKLTPDLPTTYPRPRLKQLQDTGLTSDSVVFEFFDQQVGLELLFK